MASAPTSSTSPSSASSFPPASPRTRPCASQFMSVLSAGVDAGERMNRNRGFGAVVASSAASPPSAAPSSLFGSTTSTSLSRHAPPAIFSNTCTGRASRNSCAKVSCGPFSGSSGTDDSPTCHVTGSAGHAPDAGTTARSRYGGGRSSADDPEASIASSNAALPSATSGGAAPPSPDTSKKGSPYSMPVHPSLAHCARRMASLLSTRCIPPPAAAASIRCGKLCRAVRSRSSASVPRPGPSSTSVRRSGPPSEPCVAAAHTARHSPNIWDTSGAVTKSPPEPITADGSGPV
mmetsp:Transcript_40323/g.78872  ORF Transcript_40323/g.78872 Transcript_40323/m.78872 type:complete len:291 (-) Transcript_40323:404-1276(-)